MGAYLNPGNSKFAESIASQIYVDKTGIIEHINGIIGTRQKYICVSRPRRFGKSMTADMLAAYYGKNCDSDELFRGLKIAVGADYRKYLNHYNVIALNIQDFLSTVPGVDDMITYMQERILRELRKAYPDVIESDEHFLSMALADIYSETGDTFVFIVDEWDCLLREKGYTDDDYRRYLDFIRNLFKDKSYIALVYMTGILPIKKYGSHSALNMFDEFSMVEPGDYAEYIGFTGDEVEKLCADYGIDFSDMSDWYDGYQLKGSQHIYNPKSVVDSIIRREFASYWTRTETYEALRVYIDMDYDGLKGAIINMLAGERQHVNTAKFQNDMNTFNSMDDVLTLLVHLGYLAYDTSSSTVWIPNKEIRGEFINAVEGSKWTEVIKAVKTSDYLLHKTWEKDSDAVARILDECHMENTSVLTYNDENALSCVISLAYYNAVNDYTRIRELPTGKGYADIVYLPHRHSDKPAMVVELKYDKAVDGAIAQIKERKYVESLKDYQGDLLLVGVSYDKKSKRHSCVIEEFTK